MFFNVKFSGVIDFVVESLCAISSTLQPLANTFLVPVLMSLTFSFFKYYIHK